MPQKSKQPRLKHAIAMALYTSFMVKQRRFDGKKSKVLKSPSADLIDWLYGVKHHFQQYFSYYIAAASSTIHAFLYFFEPVLRTVFFQATFPHNHRRNNGQRWERINPIAMTIISPRKEYWASRRIEPATSSLKSSTLPIELLGSAERGFGRLSKPKYYMKRADIYI